jgi:hypothetical protein
MAKSFKNIINEVYEPKSPDEKKFKDKHISKLFPNMFADSQYDKLFKGSTTEIDRGKDRHGYNPGEDEKVYEDTQLDETFQSGDEVSFIHPEHGNVNGTLVKSHPTKNMHRIRYKGEVHVHHGPLGPPSLPGHNMSDRKLPPKPIEAMVAMTDPNVYEQFDLFEKAMSVAQQKLMAIALRYKRDPESVPDASDSVKKLADSMSEKQLSDFAETKHKGLPKKVED